LYRYIFDIPYATTKKFESNILFDKIKKEFTTQKLFNELIKVIKSGPIVNITKCGGVLGRNNEGHRKPDEILIDPRIRLAELPGVLIHELLHSLFPQLDEREILGLEFFFTKKAKKWQITKIVNLTAEYCKLDFKFYIKRVHVKNILKRK